MIEKQIPSYWSSDEQAGCTLKEFITYAVQTGDRGRFNIETHLGMNKGGPGKCTTGPDCVGCEVLKERGLLV